MKITLDDAALMGMAKETARIMLADLKDHGGVPLFEHTSIVAHAAYELTGNNAKAYIAGMLHDVVEDTHYTLAQVRERFGGEMVEIVRLLTHTREDSYEEYILKIAQSRNLIAMTVKLVDLLHNTDPTRSTNPSQQKVRERNKARYMSAISTLALARFGCEVQSSDSGDGDSEARLSPVA